VIVIAASLAMSWPVSRAERFVSGLAILARHLPPPELPHTRVFELFASAPREPELSDFGDVIFHNTSDGVLICNPSLVIEDVAHQVERRGLVGKPLGSVIPRPRRDTDPSNNVYNFFEAVRLGHEVVSKSVDTTAVLGTEVPVRVDASVIRAPRGVVGYLLKVDNKSELERARAQGEQNEVMARAVLAKGEVVGDGPGYVIAVRAWAQTANEARKCAEAVRTSASNDAWFVLAGVLESTTYAVGRCDPRHALAFARTVTSALAGSCSWSAAVASDERATWRTANGRWQVRSRAFQTADEMLELCGLGEVLAPKRLLDETGRWPGRACAGRSSCRRSARARCGWTSGRRRSTSRRSSDCESFETAAPFG
jgi:hypothetical protein